MGSRALHRLSHVKVNKLKEPGVYEDGGGLRLVIGEALKKRWIVRVTINGKRRERGLGGFPTVSLEAAREQAGAFRTAAEDGRDLATERRKQSATGQVTFEKAFDAFFDIRKRSLRNAKHIQQWECTMRRMSIRTLAIEPLPTSRPTKF